MNEPNDNDNQIHTFLFKKASVGKRVAAFFIDLVVFYFLFIFVLFVSSTIFVIGGIHAYPYNASGIAHLLIFVISVLAFLVLFSLRDIIKGQSIGKRLLGIGVRCNSDNFRVPTMSKLFCRQVFTFICLIEFLVLVFSDDTKKIGDMVTDTSVYDLQEYENFVRNAQRMASLNQTGAYEHAQRQAELQAETSRQPRAKKSTKIMIVVGIVLAIAVFIGAIIFFITSLFSMLEDHPAFQIAIEEIRADAEIEAAIGEVERFRMSSGSVHSTGGVGNANFTILARGTYGEVRVFVDLQTCDDGDWEIIRFDFVQLSGRTLDIPFII